MTKIMITVKDGVVKKVCANQEGIQLKVIDYDTYIYLGEEIKTINGEDGYICDMNEVYYDKQLVEDTFKEIDGDPAQEGMHGVYVEEDSVTIYDRGEEIVHWVIDEIEEDPMVAMSVANALHIYYTQGMDRVKQLIGTL